MPSIESTINDWQLPGQLRDKFVTYILGEEQGYKLENDVDESFTFNDEELKAAGIVTAKDRKLILAKLNSGNSSHRDDAYLALQRQINVLKLEREYKLPSSSASTLQAQQFAFKMSLVRMYVSPGATQMPATLTCMVSGLSLPHEEVKAAHLFSKLMHVEALYSYGVADIFDRKNGLLWCDAIEKAWRERAVAILVDPDTGVHTFYVLTDRMMLTKLADMLPTRMTPRGLNRTQAAKFQSVQQMIRTTYGTMTFANLDGISLRFPPNCQTRPMQRALVHAARGSIAYQKKKGTLRKLLQFEPRALEATSQFDGKDELNDWLETTIPEDVLANGSI